MKTRAISSGCGIGGPWRLLMLFLFLLVSAGTQASILGNDSDGDGVVDSLDLDDDNDGIPDIKEFNCPPAFKEDFGTGSSRAAVSASASTTYLYRSSGNVQDGEYSLSSSTAGLGGWWHSLAGGDHTPGDTDGRVMVVNADFTAGEFYRGQVSGLQLGMVYFLTMWIANGNTSGSPILPDVLLSMEPLGGGLAVAQRNSGPIPNSTTLDWYQFGVQFVAIDTAMDLVLSNVAAGGMGNDLFLDDIEIYDICDSDGDGIGNYLDSDSDNDGCPDAWEAGHGLPPQSDSTVPGPYGANGLALALQDSQLADQINYDISAGNSGFAFNDSTHSYSCAELSVEPDSIAIFEDNMAVAPVLFNDDVSFTTFDSSSLSIVSNASNGMATPMLGQLIYFPFANFFGLDTVTYQVCDTGSLCDTGILVIEVQGVDDAPFANNDADTCMEDGSTYVSVLDNDNDLLDGGLMDTSSLAITVQASNGTATVQADGRIRYQPNPNFNGNDQFWYSVSDLGYPFGGLRDTTFVDLLVIAVNDTPVAGADTVLTYEDSLTRIHVLANDRDAADGLNMDSTSVSILSAPANGTATVLPDGSIGYQPDTAFAGMDSFRYQVFDRGFPLPAIAVDAWVRITVWPVNDPLALTDDFGSLAEDDSLDINILANDTDPLDQGNLDTMQLLLLSLPANGVLNKITPDTYRFVPDSDFFGNDTFSYEICDTEYGTTQCDTAFVYLSISSVNDPPVATDDQFSLTEDVSGQFSVLLNDWDSVDLSPLPVSGVSVLTPPVSGLAVVNASGEIVYTPNPDFFGKDSLLYRLCDNGLPTLCDTAALRIQVDPANDAPVANGDAVTMNEDATAIIPLLFNDNGFRDLALLDPSGMDTIGGPAYGQLVLLSNGSVQYQPDTDFFGTDSFQYEICDTGVPMPALCDTASVVVTVNGVNDAPIAANDNSSTNEDQLLSLDLLLNDSDAKDGMAVDSTYFSILQQPVNGSIAQQAGSLLSYQPNTDFFGNDSLQYLICDAGGLCDTAWWTITVNPVNDAPVAVDDILNLNEDNAAQVDLLANDNDAADGGVLSTSNLVVAIKPLHGALVLGTGFLYDYTPDPDFHGSDSAFYHICDAGGLCDSAWLRIAVQPVNDAPVAGDDLYVLNEDGNAQVDVLINDHDNADGIALPLTGVSILAGPFNGSGQLQANGEISYVPLADFNGADSIVYRICDNGFPAPSLCDTAVLRLSVLPVNDAPLALDDAWNTMEDQAMNASCLANDHDSLDAAVLGLGNISILVPPVHGVKQLNANASMDYFPHADFHGTDSMQYRICDAGGLCDTAWIRITVSPVNDAPQAGNDILGLFEDGSINISLIANDYDTLDAAVLRLSSVAFIRQTAFGTASWTGPGHLSYQPNADANGIDTLTYEICDSGIAGIGIACDTAMVLLEVMPVNDAPIASDDSLVVSQADSGGVFVLANDNDHRDGASLLPSGLRILQTAVNGQLQIDATGAITYVPQPAFSGSERITYEICDTGSPAPALCDTAELFILVTPDVPPIAVSDSVSVQEDGSTEIQVLLNDLPGDNPIDPSSLALISQQTAASAHISMGVIVYVTQPDYYGQDVLSYRICDSVGLCDTGLVYLTVMPVNDAPLALDDTVTTGRGDAVLFDPIVNDNDAIDLVSLSFSSFSALSGPYNGQLNSLGNQLEYDPDGLFFGLDSVIYQVCDTGFPGPGGLCDTAVIRIQVLDDLLPPDLMRDSMVVVMSGNTLQLVVSNAGQSGTTPIASGGVLIDSRNGSSWVDAAFDLNYQPDPKFIGYLDSSLIYLCDQSGLCDTSWIYFLIDHDMDTKADICDVDDDNDGVIDSLEFSNGWVDTDGDGWPDHIDLDSDNDGIFDVVEASGVGANSDPDGDGIIGLGSPIGRDSDGDGLLDGGGVIPVDSDGDGVIDMHDLDSDNDGLTDLLEALAIDIDPFLYDSDGDGRLDDLTDSDGDGIADICDPDFNSAFPVPDTDNDIKQDFRDVDSDQDGISDLSESGGAELDLDNDGIIDGFIDADGDGLADFLSPNANGQPIRFVDEDNNGVPDFRERFAVPTGISPNNDGLNDRFVVEDLFISFPNAELSVYNRYGDEVWRSSGPYQNDWDGRSFNGSPLPDGTYFYVLQLNKPGASIQKITNYVVINRGN